MSPNLARWSQGATIRPLVGFNADALTAFNPRRVDLWGVHLDLREAFRVRGATIECLNFRFDETPEGEFIETIMAAQGALERKQNGRQVAQKMKARMQLGYWVHNAPVGFRYQTVKGHGKLLKPDEPHASVVREAIEGFAIGRFQTQAEVKRFLETKPDYPHNKNGKVRDKRITDLLTNPLYVGYVCSEVYELNWLIAQRSGVALLKLLKNASKTAVHLFNDGCRPQRRPKPYGCYTV